MLAGIGPVVDVQLVMPPTPVIAQVPAAEGAIAPVGPVTVAVKVIVAPKAAVEDVATTATVGATGFTVVEAPEVGGLAR